MALAARPGGVDFAGVGLSAAADHDVQPRAARIGLQGAGEPARSATHTAQTQTHSAAHSTTQHAAQHSTMARAFNKAQHRRHLLGLACVVVSQPFADPRPGTAVFTGESPAGRDVRHGGLACRGRAAVRFKPPLWDAISVCAPLNDTCCPRVWFLGTAGCSGISSGSVWSGSPIRDANCCYHPLTGVPHLRPGPRRDQQRGFPALLGPWLALPGDRLALAVPPTAAPAPAPLLAPARPRRSV